VRIENIPVFVYKTRIGNSPGHFGLFLLSFIMSAVSQQRSSMIQRLHEQRAADARTQPGSCAAGDYNGQINKHAEWRSCHTHPLLSQTNNGTAECRQREDNESIACVWSTDSSWLILSPLRQTDRQISRQIDHTHRAAHSGCTEPVEFFLHSLGVLIPRQNFCTTQRLPLLNQIFALTFLPYYLTGGTKMGIGIQT